MSSQSPFVVELEKCSSVEYWEWNLVWSIQPTVCVFTHRSPGGRRRSLHVTFKSPAQSQGWDGNHRRRKPGWEWEAELLTHIYCNIFPPAVYHWPPSFLPFFSPDLFLAAAALLGPNMRIEAPGEQRGSKCSSCGEGAEPSLFHWTLMKRALALHSESQGFWVNGS